MINCLHMNGSPRLVRVVYGGVGAGWFSFVEC